MRDRRLYLFDIDGTLVNTGGAGGAAMREAFAALWGESNGFGGIELSGRTDRAIFRDAFLRHGCEESEFEASLRRFKLSYFPRLRRTLREREGSLLPGAGPLLQNLSADPNATLALGTGNFRRGAALKLERYGVAHHFSGGGFGDAVFTREEMVGEALRWAERRRGRHATAFVIGDTVHDVAAARATGCVAVAVTTGPATAEELSAAGAEVVVDSLEAAGRALGLR